MASCGKCGGQKRAESKHSYCDPCKRAYQTEWRGKNLERVRAADRRRYEQSDTVRAERKANARRWQQALRQEILEAYGRACACCGETHEEFLTLDHVGGREGDHVGAATHKVYMMVKREGFPTDKYRLLCWNCNLAHGLYGYCPHERERLEVVNV